VQGVTNPIYLEKRLVYKALVHVYPVNEVSRTLSPVQLALVQWNIRVFPYVQRPTRLVPTILKLKKVIDSLGACRAHEYTRSHGVLLVTLGGHE
jgi:hypothetical protein